MSQSTKLIVWAGLVGGVCGAAGAAFYIAWRASHRSSGERASVVLGQLEQVAERMQETLRGVPPSQ